MPKRIGVTSLAVMVTASVALAQLPVPQGVGQQVAGLNLGGFLGRRGPTMGYLQLADMQPVQTELKATEVQKTSITELRNLTIKQGQERRAAHEEGLGSGPPNFRDYLDLSQQQRDELVVRYRKEAAEREQKYREALAGILDGGQMKRLREVWIQMQGIDALRNDEIAGELKITERQKDAIGETRDAASREMAEQLQQMFAAPRNDTDEERFAALASMQSARARLEELRTLSEVKILGILTDEQQKQFADMQGDRFELPPGALGRGPRGRRPDDGTRNQPGGDGARDGGGNRP